MIDSENGTTLSSQWQSETISKRSISGLNTSDVLEKVEYFFNQFRISFIH